MVNVETTYLRSLSAIALAAVLSLMVPATSVFAQAAAGKPGSPVPKKVDKPEKAKAPGLSQPSVNLGPKASKDAKDDKGPHHGPMADKAKKEEGPKGNKDDKDDKAKKEKDAKSKGRLIVGEDDHRAMMVYHKNGMEHAKALFHYAKLNTQLNKEVINEHLEEISRSIEAAKRHQAALEKATAEETKLKVKHESFKSRYAAASELQAAIKAEASKAEPDLKLIKERITDLYHELKKAETEHKSMKFMRKITEPTEPPAKGAKAPTKDSSTTAAPAAK